MANGRPETGRLAEPHRFPQWNGISVATVKKCFKIEGNVNLVKDNEIYIYAEGYKMFDLNAGPDGGASSGLVCLDNTSNQIFYIKEGEEVRSFRVGEAAMNGRKPPTDGEEETEMLLGSGRREREGEVNQPRTSTVLYRPSVCPSVRLRPSVCVRPSVAQKFLARSL